MIILDPNELLPNVAILHDVIDNHPLNSNLATHLNIVEVFLSEHCDESPDVKIETNLENRMARLGLGRSSQNKTYFKYILYHEFGHVADRANPDFEYSERRRTSLSESEQIAVDELWNLFIDARLNHAGVFDLGALQECYSLKHGRLPNTIQGKLQSHAVMLENQGIPYKRALKLASGCWKSPPGMWTYEEMVAWVKENTGEQNTPADAA